MTQQITNILIGGEAGQGLVTVGTMLARSLVRHGYEIVVTQGYQSRIRGGHNTFEIRVSDGVIAAPQEGVDLLVALDDTTVALHRDELTDRGHVVADAGCAEAADRMLKVPFEELADKRAINVVALGVAASLLGLEEERIAKLLEQAFGKKGEEVAEKNRAALAAAYRWTAEQETEWKPLPKPRGNAERLMLGGNQAIALGALSAGVGCYAFYPMTPATSVGLALVAVAKEMGIVVEQVEDEIAAINFALGAAYAGTPAMVGTSGGGFALMVEGVSLAAAIETPIVVVIAQRPGPATGLPTRTEQGDLEFILHAGHGEFPRALFAPGSVEECFSLTRKAFELAEAAQSPCFVLTDQFLADSFRAVEPFPVEDLPAVVAGDRDISGTDYERFAVTPSGVSPRALPGRSEALVVVDSDEHTADGHLTEDLDARVQQVEKRLRKGKVLTDAIVASAFDGSENADLLLVSWGSTKGAVAEAAARLRDRGTSVAMLHFAQVWPLAPKGFLEKLRGAKRVVAVENNATAQFAKLLRRETGFECHDHIVRFDGLPITPEYILRAFD